MRVFLFLLFACTTLPIYAATRCQLNALPIVPLAVDRHDVFVGKSAQIEVRFVNEKEQGEIDVFPEPPLTIMQLAHDTQCEIDGGVWVRKAVFLSADSKTLMTKEYSGSNDQLKFYNTQSCKKTGEIDVSNATWKLKDDAIVVNYQGAQKHKQRIFKLNQLCTPMLGKND